MTAPAESHYVTLSHELCEHEPDDPDDFVCSPRIDTAECRSKPESRCRFGCPTCEWWFICDGGESCDDLRREHADNYEIPLDEVLAHPTVKHCNKGHAYTDHGCYAVDWIGGLDVDEVFGSASDAEIEPGEVWPDGLVDIVTWYEDEFTIAYADRNTP